MADTSDPFQEPPALVRVDVVTGEQSTRVVIAGEIDLSTVDAAQHKIAAALERSDPGHLVVDLRGLTFMDSTGLRLLLWLSSAAGDSHHELTIVRPPPDAHRAIQIAGLDTVLPFVDDPADVPTDA
jgi:anti-sigma B factor antagonist